MSQAPNAAPHRWGVAATALCTAMCVVAPRSGHAERPPAVEALYQSAKIDLREGRPEVALESFRRCLAELDDERERWLMTIGIGLAHERMGASVLAVTAYREVVGAAERHPAVLDEAWSERLGAAREKLGTLEPDVLQTHALVSVSTAPAGAEVTVDGAAPAFDVATRTPIALYLPASAHVITLSLGGFEPAEVRIAPGAGDRVPVDVVLRPKRPPVRDVPAVGGATPDGPKPTPSPPPPPKRDDALVWALMGTGAALAVTGGVLYGLAVSDRNEQARLDWATDPAAARRRYDDLTESLDAKQIGAFVSWGAAGAALIGGLVAYLSEDDGISSDARVHVRPRRGGAELGATLSF